MVHCAAIDCTNSSSKKKDENISFFKLPKDSRRKIWIAKLKRENLPRDEHVHCFKRDLKVFILFYHRIRDIIFLLFLF